MPRVSRQASHIPARAARRLGHAVAWRYRRFKVSLRIPIRRTRQHVRSLPSRAQRHVRRLGSAAKQRSGILNKVVLFSRRHVIVERNRKKLPMHASESVAIAGQRLREMDVPDDPHPDVVEPGILDIAVVVPTFRDEQHLRGCLESVRRQTYPHWRCYVIDDASPLEVGSIVREFSSKDDRFVFARHGMNAGLAAARNTGLVLAAERLVQFLDADDLLTPWALEVRVNRLRQDWNDPLVAGTHGYIVQCPEEAQLSDLRSWKARTPEVTRQDWLSSGGESPFNVHAPLLRVDILRSIGGFDETLINGAEDWDLWQRVLRHGYVFVPTQSVVGAYRQRAVSMVREFSGVHLARADTLLAASEQWAKVLPDVAVADATMPIGLADIALRRMIRGARWAGIRAAQLRRPAEAVDDEILAFVNLTSMPGTRRSEIVSAARGGLVRGLGLSQEVVHLLDQTELKNLHLASVAIADRLLSFVVRPSERDDAIDLTARIFAETALVADTSADVQSLMKQQRAPETSGPGVVAITIDYAKGDEGALRAWRATEIEVVPYNAFLMGRCHPQQIVVRQPLGPVTAELVDIALNRGISITVLEEPDRELTVDESPPKISLISRKDPLSIVAERGIRFGTLGSTFTVSLPLEEGVLEASGSHHLQELKNAHAGETVVVIGNGPSLNKTDLDLLAGRTTFGVNSIFLASDRLPEPLTYYVVEDQAVFRDNTAAIKDYEAGTKLFPTNYLHYYSGESIPENTFFFRMNTGFYGRKTGTYCHARFSGDASQRLYCGQSVTALNLQLAYWMGFRRTILIGMDFSYSIPDDADRNGDVIVSRSDDPNHFHPGYFGPGKTWHDPKLDRVLINYRLARDVFRADEREIINATVGGHLELFPRLSLREALDKGET